MRVLALVGAMLLSTSTLVVAEDESTGGITTHYLAQHPGGCPEGPPCPGLHAKGQCVEKGTVSDMGDFPVCYDGEKSDIKLVPVNPEPKN